jgi:hypothetical protein
MNTFKNREDILIKRTNNQSINLNKMNANNNKSMNSKKTQSSTPYCKVCEDAKQPKHVVTSHSVRKNGVVVCPTLLSQQCRYCHKSGHTVKYCVEQKKRQEQQEHQQRQEEHQRQARQQQQRPILPVQNAYSSLYDSDEEDAPSQEQEQEQEQRSSMTEEDITRWEFQQSINQNNIEAAKARASTNWSGSYAAACLKPKADSAPAPVKQLPAVITAPVKPYIPIYATVKYDPTKPKSWTNYDLYSSDEEDEDEEVEDTAW